MNDHELIEKLAKRQISQSKNYVKKSYLYMGYQLSNLRSLIKKNKSENKVEKMTRKVSDFLIGDVLEKPISLAILIENNPTKIWSNYKINVYKLVQRIGNSYDSIDNYSETYEEELEKKLSKNMKELDTLLLKYYEEIEN